jgi:transposase-like protein
VAVVTKARRKHKRDPNDGYHLQIASGLPAEEKRAKVQELCAAGVSTRDIAVRLGMHQTQVIRWRRAT